MTEYLINMGVPAALVASCIAAHRADRRIKRIAEPKHACVICTYEQDIPFPPHATHRTCERHAQMPKDTSPALPPLPMREVQG